MALKNINGVHLNVYADGAGDPLLLVHGLGADHTQMDVFETKLTPRQFAAAGKALSGFDFREDLPRVTAKTLVISGKYDGLNPPEEGKEVASLIPDSRYVEMQYSGHLPIREEPGTYLKSIRNFLLSP